MVIEKVIFTIDDNPHYMGFWASISKHYKTRMNITPVLYVIGDKNNINIKKYTVEYGEVRFHEKIEEIPTIIQALIGKFYFTIYEPNTTWLIGDLDLYPLQQFHFKQNIKNIDDNFYIHLNPYAYGVNWRNNINGLAGYFHVAKGTTFSEELKFKEKTFKDVCSEIFNSNKFGIKFYNNLGVSNESISASKDYGWFCCEEMYTGFLLKNSEKLIELPPLNNSYNRLDRSNLVYNETSLLNGEYIDFHSPRPYEDYSNFIENIVSKIPIE